MTLTVGARLFLEFVAVMALIRMSHMMVLYREVLTEMRDHDDRVLAFDPKYSVWFLIVVYWMVAGICVATWWNVWKGAPFNPFLMMQIVGMVALYFVFGKMIGSYKERRLAAEGLESAHDPQDISRSRDDGSRPPGSASDDRLG